MYDITLNGKIALGVAVRDDGGVAGEGSRVSYRILRWRGKQDSSRMIVCKTRACLLGAFGGMPPLPRKL